MQANDKTIIDYIDNTLREDNERLEYMQRYLSNN